MKEQPTQKELLDEMIKNGTLNVLAQGYKGVKLWRAQRAPITPKESQKKSDEKEA